jgi:hypothetical protein
MEILHIYKYICVQSEHSFIYMFFVLFVGNEKKIIFFFLNDQKSIIPFLNRE